ncbi:MAG: GTP-binding protein, partial [Planctomycetota bacterium]
MATEGPAKLVEIRNFCIIAHVDHGKSTLADRLIQACGAVKDRDFRDQLLDSMDIERERGITIKSNSVSMTYDAKDGKQYQLNLIDTPGHVDFSHEVRRSLMSCEGALLIVDASQGVEAQTVANLYVALEYDLELVPVINKIDLPAADPERVLEEIDADLGLDPFESVRCSAKNNIGIDDVLEAIVTKLPAPAEPEDDQVRTLIFDAQYDPYRGVVLLVRVKSGTLRPGQKVRLMHTEKEYDIEEVGLLGIEKVKMPELNAGTVGYVIAGIKAVRDINIGDTITDAKTPC